MASFEIKIRAYLREILVYSTLLLSFLMSARLIQVLAYGDWIELQNSSRYFAEFFIRAFRFDLKLVATTLILFVWLPLLLTTFVPGKIFTFYLRLILKILLFSIIFLEFVDIGYLAYFQKPIDVLIFGLQDDDTWAVLGTMLNNSDLILLCVVFSLTSFIVIWLFSKLTHVRENIPDLFVRPKRQIAVWFVVLIVLVILARGSIDTFPLQRKHAAVSDSNFLNSMVMNSAFNLRYAFGDRKVANEEVFNRDIIQHHGLSSLEQLMQKAGYDDSYPLIRSTDRDLQLEKIKPHVVFVLMEGWSTHIGRKQSVENNVLGEFAKHAEQDHFYTQFFANHYATNPSIEALLLNTSITPLSQSVARKTHFKLSNVAPYKYSNYQTLFLSGGYSSWRNHNDFWLRQGFDQYIGRSKIEQNFQVRASDNPWGVYDEYVFKFLKQSLLEADLQGESLFSFVLTTNNHPPIRLPASYEFPPLDPGAYGEKGDDHDYQLSLLKGYHYQSEQLGRFISWIKDSPLKDKVIIVATGDHPQRTFIGNTANSDQYLRYSVPAYFYVPEALDKIKDSPNSLPGSHNDLFPTLFELSLSEISYYNFGQPIMEKSTDFAYGWASAGAYLFSNGVVDSRNEHLYNWADNSKFALNPEPGTPGSNQSRAIKREKYRDILKKHLLVHDYQKQKK